MKPDKFWAEAERIFEKSKFVAQPPNSKTPAQYATENNVGLCMAQKKLKQMREAGIMERCKWNGSYVYWPVKKNAKR